MAKTKVYPPEKELAALHRIAKAKKRRVANLVREAVPGPVAIWDGPFAGSSADHDAAFDTHFAMAGMCLA